MKRRGSKTAKGRDGVVCFGEVLLALSTSNSERFEQARELEVTYTGAEANTAVALARLGTRSRVISRLPAHPLGQAAVNTLRTHGVDTRDILRGGTRMGILFLEKGVAQRPAQVLYDRKGSAFAELKPGMIPWTEVLEGYAWLHFSGISPAFGPGVTACLREGLQTARKLGLGTSMDCNYRSTLWGEAEARKILPKLVDGLDLFSGSVHDLKNFFGCTGVDEQAAEAMRKKYGIGRVALGLRVTKAEGREEFSALLSGKGGSQRSQVYEVSPFGRIGSGDAFMAGLLHGLLAGWDDARLVEFAAAAACLKQTIVHDLAIFGKKEIEEWVLRGGGGGVRR